MGRIKSKLVKRTSLNLLKEENQFNHDFEHNKMLLGDLFYSKKIRNQIAGFISRLKKQKSKK
jgi:ribosomal protein S17E